MNLYTQEILNELKKVEESLIKSVKSKNSILEEECRRLINAGGKRLRPALLINSAKFGNYDGKAAINLSASVELLHLATLVHDDVIDEAELRRSKPATHKLHGNKIAIFTGDFLVTKSLLLTSKYLDGDSKLKNSSHIAKILKSICEGEVEQYKSRNDLNVSTTKYLKRIKYKTALLFGLSCQIGAETAECDKNTIKYLRKFGMTLGTVFQLQDDILDFEGTMDKLGKPVLHDITVGIYTLPVIYALNSKKYKNQLKDLLQGDIDENSLSEISDIVKSSGGIEYTKKLLDRYIEKAKIYLEKLPDNKYRKYLYDLTEKLLGREI
ncbi:polyprenyl synthetase family protein [Sporosalibacterium faouarense]|uniref:polyprenyl synthetase family protein n=1 Tax=Sporosalibacterium faouarense TaxID=516123 RepID=UPI00141C1971|nr:polyprenyl synthetase family protein [Sporosalibacterium faouarense]MTI48503.1 polyprenyl synthetase family protein [Bacillota bacterium]